MPSSYNLPDYPVLVQGTPENRVQISGTGDVKVDDEALEGPVVVDKAVFVTGSGYVTTELVGPPPKAPRKPRPSELKKKAAKAPAKGKKK